VGKSFAILEAAAILNMASWYNESDGIIDRRILR
jgi:hypothetical protein